MATDASAATNASPFALAGLNLVANGYSPIPIAPGTKFPGAFKDKEWRPAGGWSRFCTRAATAIELELWSKLPNAGVGVALGYNCVIAVDFDTEDPVIVDAIEAVLPQSPVRKRGNKGHSGFYRASPAVETTRFRQNGTSVLELLCSGTQTVLPPSLHPTGKPYAWLTDDTLEHVRPEHLPMLPDDIAEKLSEVLQPFGVVFQQKPQRPQTARASEGGGDDWSETNAAALANLGAWIPALKIGARPHGKRYRAQAKWRNGDGFNVSFHPNGIKDFVTGEGYSPIDIVAKVADVEPYEAMRMLRKQLGLHVEPDPPPVHFIFRKGSVWPTLTRDAPEADRGHEETQSGLGAERNAPELEAEAEAQTTGRHGERDPLTAFAPWCGVDWTRTGGDLGLLADHLEASARWPNRGLAVLGALSIISALCGRHTYGPTGAAPNLYITAVAPTGEGKDSVFKSIGKILRLVRQEELYEPSFPHSNTALEDLMVDKPGVVVCVDEIGTSLFQKILSKKAGGWERDMKATINSLHSRRYGEEPFATKRHAKDRGGGRNTPACDKIYSPSLSIFGIGTHYSIWGAIKAVVLEDGFLNRWLIIPVSGGQPRNRDHLSATVDDQLLNRLASIPPVIGGNLTHPRGVFAPFAAIEERTLPWESDEVGAWAEHFEDALRNVGKGDPVLGQILPRVFENACSASIAHAVGRAGRGEATITREDFIWGASLALVSARHMIENAEGISEDDYQAKYNAVRQAIRKGGKGTPCTIKRRDLRRAVVVDVIIFERIIHHLKETNQITAPDVKSTKPGRPADVYSWVEE